MKVWLKRNARWLGLVALMGVVMACTLPGIATPAPFIYPTPNLTMTAFFAPEEVASPTASPEGTVAVVPSPTMLPPTPTSPPPTAPPSAAPPTPTAPPPANMTRPGPGVHAAFLSATPVSMDGNLDDWPALTAYPARSVVYGAANYRGVEDLAGQFRVGWDEEALYLAVEVTDDVLVQMQHGAQMYKGDDVELQIDANLYGDFYVNGVNDDDYQIGLSPGSPPGQAPEAYLWLPRGDARALTEVQVGVALRPHGYVLEAKIPWSVIGFVPRPGMTMGFALNLSDDDLPGQAVQQTMLSNDPYRQLLDPATWGTLAFDAP